MGRAEKRAEKESRVSDVEDKLKRATAAVLTDYRGLNVHELAELRRDLRAQGVEYKIYKNTLSRRAAVNADLGNLVEHLKGPTAIAFGFDDPVAAAKLVSSFAKKHAQMSVKGGLLEGKVIDAAAIRMLAALPSREVLLAMLAGTLQAPVSGLATVLNGPIRGLAMALGQVAGAKSKEA